MSGLLGEMNLGYANLFSEIPERAAAPVGTYAQAGLQGAETAKTQVETQMEQIRVQAAQKQMEMLQGVGGNQQNYYTDAARFGVPQSGMQPGTTDQTTTSVVPPASSSMPPANVTPGGSSGMGAPSVTPPPPAPSAAATPGATALARYGPGSYQTADLSGTTPPPTAPTAAPPATPQGSVFLGQATSQPVPATTVAPPAAPAGAPGSAQLQNQGAPPNISPNGVNIPGVGPISRVMAATMYGAIANGQDMGQAMKTAQEMRYRRLAELASQGITSGQWQTSVMTAYNEGLITSADAQRELNAGPQDQLRWVNSFTDAANQMANAVNLANRGMGIGPGGIGPAAGPLAGIWSENAATVGGQGVIREIEVPDDPRNPSGPRHKVFLTPSEVPGIVGGGPQSNAAGGPDPVAGLPVEQARPLVAQRESGNRNIEGPVDQYGVRHSGYYQFGDNTWLEAAKLAGIQNPPPRAIMASKADQDAAFNALYARDGARPWAASNPNRGRAPGAASMAPQTQGVVGGGAGMGQPGGPPPAGAGFLATAAAREPPPALGGVASVAGATPPAPTRTAGAGNTFVIGDSHAGGLRTQGLPGVSTDGLNPLQVRQLIAQTPGDQIAGKDVVLSSGAANNPLQAQMAYDEIQDLKAKGAKSVKLLGIGPGADPAASEAANRQLALAAGRANQNAPGFASFQPLTGPFQPGGVHLQNYGPLAKDVRTSAATPAIAPYQTASLGFTPPPTAPSRATPAAVSGPSVLGPYEQQQLELQTEQQKQAIQARAEEQKKQYGILGDQFAKITTAGETADATRARLYDLQHAAEMFTTGTSASAREAGWKAASTALRLLGIEPPEFMSSAVTGAEVINKEGSQLAQALTNKLGSNQAATVFESILNANPNLNLSKGGFKAVVDSYVQGVQRDRDLYNFMNTWLADPKHNNSLMGMLPEFQKAHPVETYASRVLPFEQPTTSDGKIDTSKMIPDVIYKNKDGSRTGRWNGKEMEIQ